MVHDLVLGGGIRFEAGVRARHGPWFHRRSVANWTNHPPGSAVGGHVITLNRAADLQERVIAA
jgi:hypothetical protein